MKKAALTPANFNVCTREDLRQIRDWRDRTGFKVSVYEDYDGGGFNFFIVEFLSEDALKSFIENFSICREPWAEDANGKRIDWDAKFEDDKTSDNQYEPKE